MSKQEEILEGIARELYYQESSGGYILWVDLPEEVNEEYRERAIKLMTTLDSMRVVIRVDRELHKTFSRESNSEGCHG